MQINFVTDVFFPLKASDFSFGDDKDFKKVPPRGDTY